MLSVGYLQIEALVRMLGGVDDATLVLRRWKYLQRMSFPTGSNTGRGRKVAFNLDQLLQVLVAFELIQTGSTPTRAVRTVRTNWPELLPAMALGWLCARRPTLAPMREMLVMDAAALRDAGGSEDPNEKVGSPFRIASAIDLFGWGPGEWRHISRVVLDPCSLAAGLIRAAAEPAIGIDADELDDAYLELWHATRDGTPDEWSEATIASWKAQRN